MTRELKFIKVAPKLRYITAIMLLFLVTCFFSVDARSNENKTPSLPGALATSKQGCDDTMAIEHDIPVDPALFEQTLQQAEALLQGGRHKKAAPYFLAAYKSAKLGSNTRHQVIGSSALGNYYLLTDRLGEARNYLETALQLSEKNGYQDLQIITTSYLARLYGAEGKKTQARTYYKQALAGAIENNDTSTSTFIRVNLADFEPPHIAAELLAAALDDSMAVNNSSYRTQLLLAIGYRAANTENSAISYAALNGVLSSGETLQDRRPISEAHGMMAQLYKKQDRFAEALQLTGEAIFEAQQASATDLLMKWEWQQARLLELTGKPEMALDSYRRAVTHMQAIRADIPVRYTDGKSSFRETLEPLLLGLADLLLRRAEGEEDKETTRNLLIEAQNTVELIKSAELQDYFLDTCAATQRPLMDIEHLAPGTAVIYPIVFNERIEVLYGMGTTLGRVTVPIEKHRLEQTVRKIVESLRPLPGNRLRPYRKNLSAELYQWLIEPLEDYFDKKDVHTLVYVPDGVLRTLPISALWNSKKNKYLIELYAVATSPGLTLMDPSPTDRSTIKALLAGLSLPGPAVNELPEQMKKSLAMSTFRSKSSEADSMSVRGMGIAKPAVARKQNIADVEITTEILQNALALPGVISEIDALAAILPATKLVDEDFLIEQFKNKTRSSYRIIHIASHGYFSSSTENSFIMTYNHLLSMNELESMFKSEAFSDAPVELLTLSACQTAEGDDRSPLGLSGIALKSGARSALGSLWPISDDSTQRLLPAFYEYLTRSQITKAQALQQAQLGLLRDTTFSHPYFWSSFILIGNWL